MVTDRFGTLVEELGKVLKIKLSADSNGCCMIRYKSGIEVCLEPTADGRNVMIAIEVCEIPPGRFRENILREALKANGLPLPRKGVFAFSKKKDTLILYDQLLVEELTGEKLMDFLIPIQQKAEMWKAAISNGEVPSFSANELTFGRKSAGSGMLGLR